MPTRIRAHWSDSRVYFAGEVIDVDAYTGGFNLQIAWSTAYAAAQAAAPAALNPEL